MGSKEDALARTIALRLRALRSLSGQSQYDVAAAMKCRQSQIARLESGTALPRLQTLLAIADLYKVPLTELLMAPAEDASDEEVELLMLLRALPEDRRRAALATVRALAKA